MTEWQIICVPQDAKYGRKPQTLIVETGDATGLVGKPIRLSDFPWTLVVTEAHLIVPDSDEQSAVLTQ